MEFIIPVIVILAFLAIVFVRIRKQRQLEEEASKYDAMLRAARLTRWQYMQSMEKHKDAIRDHEHTERENNIIKAELCSLREEIRELARTLRHEIKQSGNTELDQRIISQLKMKFAEKWQHLNNRKIFFNEHLSQLRELEAKKCNAREEELKASKKWDDEKARVMELYKELSQLMPITDPKKYFN